MSGAWRIIVRLPPSRGPEMNETVEARRKRLIHRSRYTGMKETDLLLGAFAMRHVPRFSVAELDQYEHLLGVPDADIFDWATGRAIPDAGYDSDVLRLLKNFRIDQ